MRLRENQLRRFLNFCEDVYELEPKLVDDGVGVLEFLGSWGSRAIVLLIRLLLGLPLLIPLFRKATAMLMTTAMSTLHTVAKPSGGNGPAYGSWRGLSQRGSIPENPRKR